MADEPTRAPVIEERLARELGEHRGRWVAIDQGILIAVDDTAAGARASALKRGVTDPIVFRVPAHPERLAFF
jgi:hypothetical protein